ncbi:MAG: IS4 family transposase [Cyanobacteria bacterium P01_C01_bin.147]
MSRQAVSERFLSFPYQLFEGVFEDLVPRLKARWSQRQRPLPPSVSYAMKHFEQIWAADGSVLEALFRKLDSLQDCPTGQLAGKVCAVIELGSQLPVQIWFHEDAKAHDCQFLDDLLALATAQTLLLLDRGFYDFEWWAKLVAKQVDLICAAKSNLAYTVVQELSLTPRLKDRLIEIGQDQQGHALVRLRLIEVPKGKGWYRYVTSVLDPEVLPPYVVIDLYARRWRIEDAFHLVKRLLGLAYLWTGSLNGIKLQIWATWLIYAVLVDLSDAVAETVQLPLERISMEMVWRGLYHFNDAYNRGLANDPVSYLAAPENRDLGVIKAIRKPPKRLDFSPYVKSLPGIS